MMGTRRQFLKQTSLSMAGAVAAPLILPESALSASSPSERITIGVIGTGSHGINRNIKRFLTEQDCQIVAVCDVDRKRRLEAKKLVESRYADRFDKDTYKGCEHYNDFRSITGRDDIDAVMVATPDHWHVLPSILAAQAGKDILCEKPLTVTVEEGRILSDVIHKTNRVFMTATENRSDENYLRMCELVRNGRIGKLRRIEVGLPGKPSVHPASMEVKQVPDDFDYDMWLGQAPEKPYCEARCHWNFRWILDYSGGQLTDWGAHMIDLAQWGHNTEHTGPVEVEGHGYFPQGAFYNVAHHFSIEYKFADGVEMLVESKNPYLKFIGEEGTIWNEGWRAKPQALPKSILNEKIGENETHLYTCAAGEQRNFLDCVKSRKEPYTPVEVGHRTITIAHIGHISMQLGRKLRWNPDKERFVDDEPANWMLARPMRDPW
ncbi:gfo/Idh/MocA family oxidoreductase, partial [bacterium]|nr:gfo/Idh/MocA family oxidoreductase [bacterium]